MASFDVESTTLPQMQGDIFLSLEMVRNMGIYIKNKDDTYSFAPT